MIDTIVLLLTKDMYQISDPDKFIPSAKWVENNSKTLGFKSRQNPTKKELLKGVYKPRLTLSNRSNLKGRIETILKIELSLPKLFFGNNFDELKTKDFSELASKLANTLKQMGIITTVATLSKAPVTVIHYAKNIPLTDGSTPYHFINKIKESNIKLSLDVNQTDYRNEGHAYKWHCNAYEVVFYDKIKELEKAKNGNKRAIEKDPAFAFGYGGQAGILQLNIFEKLQNRHIQPLVNASKKNKQAVNKFEILRMEVRFNKREKLKQLFKKLKIESNLTFHSLFKTTIARKILLHYVGELASKRSTLLDYKIVGDKTLILDLMFNNPELSTKQILQMFGLKKALESINIRELRVIFGNYNQRSWYRLISEINKLRLPSEQVSFEVIKECVNKFKTLRI